MSQALTDALDIVIERFAEQGRECQLVFGWREKEQHTLERPRIVWQPGDDGGNIGEAGPPYFAGQTWPPTTGVLWQQCALFITAPGDSADPDNERKQWTNTMELRNALYSVLVNNVGYAQFRVESERYLTDVGRRANVTIVSTLSFRDDIRDEDATGVEPVNASADAELNELDATQLFHVDPVLVSP